MAQAAHDLLIITITILLLGIPVQTADPCEPDSCHPNRGPVVRFPFRLTGRQPARCGYPGFNLRCDGLNRTIMNLPRSGDFIVHHIDYKSSAVYVGDPGFCLPGRGLNFSVGGSPFDATLLARFGILNCSSGSLAGADAGMRNYYVVLPCLSTANATVAAVDDALPPETVPPGCRRAVTVSVPPWSFNEIYWGAVAPEEDFELRWSRPACGRCENRGGRCRFKEGSGFQIGCSMPSGIPKGAKYAVIIGGGVPGLLCMIGLTCYACKRIKLARQQRRVDNELPMSTFDRQLIFRANIGLDVSTIDSYPKTVLGQSRRLPNPTDNTCSICLSDYQPQETLKSIPECNHYFHATCIDEWLKLNGTCPLCRNSPDASSATPTSSTSPSLPSTATSEYQS